ncbi:hypothetical protein GCM10027062_35880 [Nocardioides hungaricus]
MSLGLRLAVPISLLALLTGGLAVAGAASAAGTELELTGSPAYADSETTLRIRLGSGAGEPIAGAAVELERRQGGAWVPLGTVTTDADGRAAQQVRLSRSVGENTVRASYAGDEQYAAVTRQVRIRLERRGSVVGIDAARRVQDGRSVQVRVRWTTRGGVPIAGTVRVMRSLAGGPWRPERTVRTDADGRAALTTRPRVDSRWRARAVRMAWVEGAVSTVRRIDNVPPGRPVRLPRSAPHPRRALPDQPRAVGRGANPVIARLPDRIWTRMAGISWRRGCPVGRDGLRLVRVNYWDYRGYQRRGELVAATGAASALASAFAEMYQRRLPIRAMYRVDRFGWGARSRGGDDYASMAAGNTSAFNCRDVTGRPGVRSPHSYGRSLDVNTWENPYRSARGLVPNTWWQRRSHPRVAWRSRSHPVVRLMARHGLRWTYGNGDTQHFDYVGSRARATVAPRACDRYCD